MSKAYFEGWYLKHQTEDYTVCLIPAVHQSPAGERSASIQVITDRKSYYFHFPEEEIQRQKKHFFIKIGRNVFSETGVRIQLQSKELSLTGELRYSRLQPPATDIMGPFRHLPFMQCRHGVLSMGHNVSGYLRMNGKTIMYRNAVGYIEKDWGSSFPSAYAWTQCNWFEGKNVSVMLAIAKVPVAGIRFWGCIGNIIWDKQEYRLATYKRARIVTRKENELVVRQGKYRLSVYLQQDKPQELKAPQRGVMVRSVMESPACRIRYVFTEGEKTLFDLTSNMASYEWMI